MLLAPLHIAAILMASCSVEFWAAAPSLLFSAAASSLLNLGQVADAGCLALCA
ncbi:MAG: hypothetical protein ACK55Z_13180 [bacterium]